MRFITARKSQKLKFKLLPAFCAFRLGKAYLFTRTEYGECEVNPHSVIRKSINQDKFGELLIRNLLGKLILKWDGNPNKKMKECNLASVFYKCPKVAITGI